MKSRPSCPGNRQLGVSLVEMLIAMVIAGVALAAILQIFSVVRSGYNDQVEMERSQEALRYAIVALKRDLRHAASGPDGLTIDGDSLIVRYRNNSDLPLRDCTNQQVDPNQMVTHIFRAQNDMLSCNGRIMTDRISGLRIERFYMDRNGDGRLDADSSWSGVENFPGDPQNIIGVSVVLDLNRITSDTPRPVSFSVALRNRILSRIEW